MTQYIQHSLSPFFKSFKRTPFRSIGIIGLLSVLFFVMFLLLMLGSLTEKSIQEAEKKVDLVFFLEKEVPEHKISLLKAQLIQMKKREKIESFRYISPEESLQIFAKKYPERFSFWKRNKLTNPFSASFEVVPKGNNILVITDTFASETFAGILDISQMQKTIEQRERSQRVLDFLRFVEKGIKMIIGVILLAIAGVTAAFISSSFILRKKEIFIMRLVGASYSFIRAPFLMEGILFTTLSLGLGWIFFYEFRIFALTKMYTLFSSKEKAEPTIQIVDTLWNEFIADLPKFISIIIILATIVSFISIERFLRKKRILQ